MIKFILFFSLITISYSTTLKQIVNSTVTNNSEIMSLEKSSQAQKYYIDEARGDFFPSLKLDAYITDIETDKETTTRSGHNIKLKLDQLIYDGGKREAKYKESKNQFTSKRYENLSLINDIILDTTKVYLNAVKHEESMILTKNNLLLHEEYLKTAIEAKEVSGESLDKIQVDSKLLSARVEFYSDIEEQVNNIVILNEYSNIRVDNNICRPIINKMLIPSTFDKFEHSLVILNYDLLKEVAELKVAKNSIYKEISNFIPTLKATLSKELDDGADTKDVEKNELEAKLTLSYNLFNGLKDRAAYKKEVLLYKEAQKRTDSLTKATISDARNVYFKFKNGERKISDLKKYIVNNKEILKIYKEQFEGGSKTFMDILNQEAEVYRAKIQLIDEEFNLFENYYTLLSYISILDKTIISYKDVACAPIIVDIDIKKSEKKESELEDLLEEDIASLTKGSKKNKKTKKPSKLKVQEKNNAKIDAMYSGIMAEIYGDKLASNSSSSIFYETNTSSSSLSLNEEFKNETSKYYTIHIPNFKSSSVNGTKAFVNNHNLSKDALVYKDEKNKLHLLFGLFENENLAKQAINKLDPYIKNKKPLVDKLQEHITSFKEGQL